MLTKALIVCIKKLNYILSKNILWNHNVKQIYTSKQKFFLTITLQKFCLLWSTTINCDS